MTHMKSSIATSLTIEVKDPPSSGGLNIEDPPSFGGFTDYHLPAKKGLIPNQSV
jgi:hypothetical protein